MRIGIDVSVLCHQWDGIGTTVLDVLRYISDAKDQNQYYLYANKALLTSELTDPRFIIRTGKGSLHLLWLLKSLPRMVKNDQIDVFWQPDYLFPFRIKNTKNVIHVDDLGAYSYHEYAPWKTNIAHRLFLKKSVQDADRIITISNTVKKEIESVFPLAKGKIQIIYPGRKMFQKDLDTRMERAKEYIHSINTLPGEYLLFVGTFSPRKNADVIAEAFLEYRNKGGTKKLVVAGNIAKKSEKTVRKLLQSTWKDDVIVTGYVTEEQKRILYYHAAVLLYPSRMEGFGIPLLEGFQAGVPVITSNVSCMPEIAGDAAIYLNDIRSPGELAQRISEAEQLTAEEKGELVKKGYRRLDFYDGQNYREQIYRALVNWEKQEANEEEGG